METVVSFITDLRSDKLSILLGPIYHSKLARYNMGTNYTRTWLSGVEIIGGHLGSWLSHHLNISL